MSEYKIQIFHKYTGRVLVPNLSFIEFLYRNRIAQTRTELSFVHIVFRNVYKIRILC